MVRLLAVPKPSIAGIVRTAGRLSPTRASNEAIDGPLGAETTRRRMTQNDCGFNRSMHHLDSHRRAQGVAYEVPNADLLHRDR